MLKNLTLILSLFIFSLHTMAQTALGDRIDFNQNPHSILWKKIDSTHFEVIFPQEVEKTAQKATFLLEKIYPFISRSLESKPRKISLILQNQSITSNGFVTLAPRRSEWYVTPSTDSLLSNTEWIKSLAVHEFRHVVQFDKARQNVNKIFEFFLGEIGTGLGVAFTMPAWFLEGDAVGIETAFTNGGRGRLPLFERDLRALLISKKEFNFDQAHLRSYKEWIPNHYVYGYFLTTFLRAKYGDLFLSQIVDEATDHAWNPLSFYNAVDSLMPGDFDEFYEESMKDLLSHWSESFEKINPSPFKIVSTTSKDVWTNYTNPMVMSSGDVIALKQGLGDINQFVKISSNTKEEKRILYPGPLVQDSQIKMRSDRFSYLEYEFDPRWGYRDFQKLVVFDAHHEKEIFSLSKTKFRLTALNLEGTKVLASEWTEDQNQNLVILDLSSKKITRIPIQEGILVTSIDWISDLEAVLVVKDNDDFKQVIRMNLLNQTSITLTPKSRINLGEIFTHGETILVESPHSGIDNIYRVENQELIPLTNSRFGAYRPSLVGENLYYADYDVTGMNVVQKSDPWRKKENVETLFYPVFEKIASFEEKKKLEESLTLSETYKVKDYSLARNSLNFHSWMILAPPLTNTISLQAFSQDLLNKFQLSFGSSYQLNERSSSVFSSLTWSEFYPVFDFSLEFGGRRIVEESQSGEKDEDKWQEGIAELGVSLPWKKIYSEFTSQFAFRAFSKVIHSQGRQFESSSDLSNQSLFSRGGELNWSHLQRTSSRDFLPPLGMTLNLYFEEGSDFVHNLTEGNLLSLKNQIFHFGVAKHHVFLHEFSFEKQAAHDYQYSSRVLFPRGIQSLFLNEFFKYSGNYTLPLAYPDYNLSRYVYFKRIMSNVFFDTIKNTSKSSSSLSSAGVELIFETHFLRIILPLTWGLRGNYILTGSEKDKINYDVFLSSNLAVF